MKTTYRVHYRTVVPDLDGGPSSLAERKPRDFDTYPEAETFVKRIDRRYDYRIHRLTDEPIFWGDPEYIHHSEG